MAAINITDLPPKYQAQALQQLQAQAKRKMETQVAGTPARSKYGNVKTGRAALHFDSKKEATRFDELMTMAAAGAIRDLRLQDAFTLQRSYITPEGQRVRAIKYVADFTYYRRAGDGDAWEFIVEDVKSKPTRTKEYLMKKKMMAERLGLTITEV